MNLIVPTTHVEKDSVNPEQRRGEEAYLSFQLTDSFLAAFAMRDVHEVAVVPLGQITPMFNLPPDVLGLLTRRSRILWTVDLSQWLCGQPMAATTSSKQLSVAVVRVTPDQGLKQPLEDRALLGLVVQRVNGYIQISPGSVQPPDQSSSRDRPSNLLSTRLPCWRGSVLKENRIHILDANAIATTLQKDAPHNAPY